MEPQVTIGLPCFNEERHVADAVRSILAQTFSNWELIVVDDGSTDATLHIIKSFSDPRMRVLSDGKNLGLAARLNLIARTARGKYIARMDADDVSHPERLRRQVEYLEGHPSVNALGTGIAIVTRDGQVDRQRVWPESAFSDVDHPLVAHPTICCKKEWALAHPYNETNRRCEDLELWLSADRSHCRNLEEVLYFYREFDSFTLTKYLAMQAKSVQLLLARRRGGIKVVVRGIIASGAYIAGAILGKTDALIERRSAPISDATRERLHLAFEAARNGVSVPAQQATLTRDP
jgi:glycosyltransferase involved in cell wall biosynthesis